MWLEFNLTPEEVKSVISRLEDPIYSDQQKIDSYKAFNSFLGSLKRIGSGGDDIYKIEIPFLKGLTVPGRDGTGADIRRFKLFQDFIKVSALLHQNHRQIEVRGGKTVLVATNRDYMNVRTVFGYMVPSVCAPAGQAHLETFRKIIKWLSEHPKENREAIKKATGISKKASEEHPNDLVDIDLLAVDKSKLPYTYSPSKRVKTALDQCSSGLGPMTSIESVIDELITDELKKNEVGFYEPQASVSLVEASGASKAVPGKTLRFEPQSLEEVQEEKNTNGDASEIL